jgi:hypothetical protein
MKRRDQEGGRGRTAGVRPAGRHGGASPSGRRSVGDPAAWRPACAAAAWVALLAGCAGPVVISPAMMTVAGINALQAGTAEYIRGRLESAEVAPLAAAYEACLDALKELGFTVNKSVLRENDAYIDAREVDGRVVEVRLSRRTPRLTKVKIRIGPFGDRAVSTTVLAAVQAHLRAREAAPEAATPSGR